VCRAARAAYEAKYTAKRNNKMLMQIDQKGAEDQG
jgi:hypothetical protein